MQQGHNAHRLCPVPAIWWEMWALNNGIHSERSILEEAGVRGVSSWARPNPASIHSSAPSMAQRELPVPIYVTRGEGQRLDNARTLHGELGGSRAGKSGCEAKGRCLSVLPDLP